MPTQERDLVAWEEFLNGGGVDGSNTLSLGFESSVFWSIRKTPSNTGEGLGKCQHMGLLSCLIASSCESYEYPQRGGDSAGRSAESVSDAVTSFLVSGA